MKKLILIISILFSVKQSLADGDYHYYVDLTKAENDKIKVTLTPPDISEDETLFMFPSMVPGTYEVYDFGRFISNFTVIDKDGKTINTERMDRNTYKILSANTIKEISYEVDDTWDSDIKEKIVFEPAGTNIEAGKNFIINTHGFFGYFKNKLAAKFILEFNKPLQFYPSTSISNIICGTNKDILSIYNYHDLIDSPIMYCKPDTSSIKIGNSTILFSVYSSNGIINSNFISRNLSELLKAQASYLGGNLPIDKYAFLFYFTDKNPLSGSSGALEHSYSSLYFLPEADTVLLAQEIRDIAAHEFFHIVTPLSIHSKEIGEFDFNTPKMSKHLWLYEGLTEYAAHHMQVKTGLIEYDAFFDVMLKKMKEAREYNDTLAFTKMSKDVLTIYKSQYANVYQKGALIGMCLDVMLRYYSNGKYGTQDLMKDLSKQYGKTNSFNDDDLFNDIEKLSYKEIRFFLDTYVDGNKPLPFDEIFNLVGMNYTTTKIESKITLGNISVGYNPKSSHLIIVNTEQLDDFGKKLKVKEGDEILTFNTKKISLENMQEILGNYLQNTKAGDKLILEVIRKDKKGNEKIKTLKAKVKPIMVTEHDVLEVNEKATEQQITARKEWLGIN